MPPRATTRKDKGKEKEEQEIAVVPASGSSMLLPPRTPMHKGKAKAKVQGTAVAPASGSSMLLSPRAPMQKDQVKEKVKDQVKETGAVGGRKCKQDADDEDYQDCHDLTTEKVVQQVMCPSHAY